MFVLVDKRTKTAYVSESKKEIANKSGISYDRLDYYARRKYYENDDLLFMVEAKWFPSKQGGKRVGGYGF